MVWDPCASTCSISSEEETAEQRSRRQLQPAASDVLGCHIPSIGMADRGECVWRSCVQFEGEKRRGEEESNRQVFRQTSCKDLQKGLCIPESLSGILS